MQMREKLDGATGVNERRLMGGLGRGNFILNFKSFSAGRWWSQWNELLLENKY